MELRETSEDLIELFQKTIDATSLDHYVKFEYTTNNRIKTPIEIKKADPISNFHYQVDVRVVFNEEILDMLPEEKKTLLFEEALTAVYFDTEKDKLTIEKPDITTFSGFLCKYNSKDVLELKESVVLAYKQVEDRREEEKNSKK